MNTKSIYALLLTASLTSLSISSHAKTISPTNSNAQFGSGGDGYSFQQLLFNEDFNVENGWFSSDIYRVNNGWYEIEGNTASGYNTTLRDVYSFNVDGDYLIEAKFEKLYGKENGGYGLIWGGKNDGNFYGFYLSGSGGFNYGKVENDAWVPISQWQRSDFINKNNAVNTISIQKKGNTIKFYVNDALIHQDTAPILKGVKMGFSTSTPKIRVDYLKISVIE